MHSNTTMAAAARSNLAEYTMQYNREDGPMDREAHMHL